MGALQVAHRVIPHRVTAPPHLLEQLGMTLHILAHHKEGGLDAIAVKRIQHPRRDLGNGAVVEGQIDRVVALVDAPHGLGK